MTYFRYAAIMAALALASSVSWAQVRTECGEPGTIAHLPGSVSESLEVRAHETCPVPGADILNRSAQGALVVHNYNATTTAPAVQVDQVEIETALKLVPRPADAPVVDGALAVVNGTLRLGAGGVWREVQLK